MKKILFQGDSITDAERRVDENGVGNGYVKFVWEALEKKYNDLTLINRGIGGNRVCDLVERWQVDTLDHKADIVTLLIGINDVWRMINKNGFTTNEDFKSQFSSIVKQTLDNGAKMIIMTPFILKCGVYSSEWDKDLADKIRIVEDVANENGITLIKLHEIFKELEKNEPSTEFAGDGVHPVDKGRIVIANHLLEELYKII